MKTFPREKWKLEGNSALGLVFRNKEEDDELVIVKIARLLVQTELGTVPLIVNSNGDGIEVKSKIWNHYDVAEYLKQDVQLGQAIGRKIELV